MEKNVSVREAVPAKNAPRLDVKTPKEVTKPGYPVSVLKNAGILPDNVAFSDDTLVVVETR